MSGENLPLDRILQGDCIEVLNSLPESSVDLIFADPPYNLQLQQELYRPNMTRVDAVNETWDHFEDFAAYDDFTRAWLSACRRVLKENGTLWVIGTYHNIYRIGAIMQDLGFWFLNDIVWIKTNPMPNFRGVRFTNAHETLLWACKQKGARYTFNHHAMRQLNDDLQMRSDWLLPLCPRPERLKENGRKAHPTQKPEALLYRIILSSSQPGDVLLDPFLGSGTSAAVAKKLCRHWVGIERQENYVRLAQERLDGVEPLSEEEAVYRVGKPRLRRLPLGHLLEAGLLAPGQLLYFRHKRDLAAVLRADGRLLMEGYDPATIHRLGSRLMNGSPCNGWEHWYFEGEDGDLHPLNDLRKQLLDEEAG
ncbi:MAG: site-specific DNA-methyltransferase [Anaerolineae bacterium]|nr:site-specific DNA-methyltransferase [Anaerolineae bacterium]